jgi:hypothetical protein
MLKEWVTLWLKPLPWVSPLAGAVFVWVRGKDLGLW